MWPPRQWRWTGTSSPHPALSAAGSGRRKRDSERFGKTPVCSSPSILRGGQAGPPVTLEDTTKALGSPPARPPPSSGKWAGAQPCRGQPWLLMQLGVPWMAGASRNATHQVGVTAASPCGAAPGALCLAGAWSSSALVTRGHCHVNLPPGLAQVSSQDWGLLRPQDVGSARAGTREAGAPVWV